MLTSATRCWKPSRSAAEAPDWPWSVSMDLLGLPAQCDRFLPQRVLARGGLGVGQHLPQCRLAHIQVGGAGQVRAGHLRRGLLAHRRSPLRRDSHRHRREQSDQLGVHTATDRRGRAGGRRRRVGRGGRLADPQPCRNPALLQHGQSQPPAVDIAAQRAHAQLLIPVHDFGSAITGIMNVIVRLHFWSYEPGSVHAPPTAGAR